MSLKSGHPITPHVKVCHLDPFTVVDPALITKLASWLDNTEKARLARFKQAEHQHAFLVSHALLRKALADRIGCTPREIRFGAIGRDKPVLSWPAPERALHFNLSHTRAMAAVALSSEPLGLDVEWLGRQNAGPELATRFFSAAEQTDIVNQPLSHQQERFLTYWTLKEAFLKAEAWGIVDRLDGFEFELDPNGPDWPAQIRLQVNDPRLNPTHPWRFGHWKISPQHLLSLAYSPGGHPCDKIDLQAWTECDWD